MIYTTITNAQQFANLFRLFDNHGFSYDGLALLFDYLNDPAFDRKVSIIDLCCKFEESSIEELINEHEIDVEGLNLEEDYDDIKDLAEEYLNAHTTVVGNTGTTILYAAF